MSPMTSRQAHQDASSLSTNPATATASLITNLIDRRTILPLLARIKVLWQLLEGLGAQQSGAFGQSELLRVWMHAEKTTNVAHIGVGMKVLTSFPGCRFCVDLVNELKDGCV